MCLRRTIAGPAVLAALAFTTAACADPLQPVRLTPGEFKWEEGSHGTDRAYLVGDEKKPGVYVFRIRFRSGDKIAPHFHPDERIVTVLSGTIYMGYGEKIDEAVLKRMPAGSIWTEPPGRPSFVWAKEGDAEVQVVGTNGPSGRIAVDQ